MGLIGQLENLRKLARERDADPWLPAVERALPPNFESISTVALLDFLDLQHTTSNARRLAKTMRALGFVPIKSRRLAPGGFRDTTTRGWARALRGN